MYYEGVTLFQEFTGNKYVFRPYEFSELYKLYNYPYYYYQSNSELIQSVISSMRQTSPILTNLYFNNNNVTEEGLGNELYDFIKPFYYELLNNYIVLKKLFHNDLLNNCMYLKLSSFTVINNY